MLSGDKKLKNKSILFMSILYCYSRRLTLGVCFLFLASFNLQALEPIPQAKVSFLDLKEDAVEAENNDRILMIIFEQEGCFYCEKMRRVNFSDKEIIKKLKNDYDIVQLDIWGEREIIDFSGMKMTEKEYAKVNNVQFTPMTILVNGSGKELLRMTGYYKPTQYKAALDYVSGHHYLKNSFRDYVRSNVQAKDQGGLKSESFYSAVLNLQTMKNMANKKTKGTILVFEQKECMGCAEMHNQLFKNVDIVDTLSKKYDVVQVDIWGKREVTWFSGADMTEAEVGKLLNIQYTPTMVFFDRSGIEIFRYDNYRKAEHFLVLLKYLSTEEYLKYDSFQDWLKLEFKHKTS